MNEPSKLKSLLADPPDNPAVQHCLKAYALGHRSGIARNRSDARAHLDGINAYRLAMPLLSGLENIRDFTACTVYGMLINAISESERKALLYAANLVRAAAKIPAPPKNPA